MCKNLPRTILFLTYSGEYKLYLCNNSYTAGINDDQFLNSNDKIYFTV